VSSATILGDGSLFASDRAVVRSHQLLTGEVVELTAESLGKPARVDEHDR
jgi:hypothetical protein